MFSNKFLAQFNGKLVLLKMQIPLGANPAESTFSGIFELQEDEYEEEDSIIKLYPLSDDPDKLPEAIAKHIYTDTVPVPTYLKCNDIVYIGDLLDSTTKSILNNGTAQ